MSEITAVQSWDFWACKLDQSGALVRSMLEGSIAHGWKFMVRPDALLLVKGVKQSDCSWAKLCDLSDGDRITTIKRPLRHSPLFRNLPPGMVCMAFVVNATLWVVNRRGEVAYRSLDQAVAEHLHSLPLKGKFVQSRTHRVDPERSFRGCERDDPDRNTGGGRRTIRSTKTFS